MTYKDVKQKLKNTLKTWMAGVSEKCKHSRLSAKSWGIIIRTIHMCAPGSFLGILLFGPKLLCKLTIAFLFGVLIMFYTFDACFLSVLEQELCKDDFVIIDPMLEICNLEITTKNRYFISTKFN